MYETQINQLASLLVEFGANVQPDQIVAVSSELGKEPLTRSIAASAYQRGAKFVEVSYADPHLKRARILNSTPDRLHEFPSWFGQRMLELGKQKCARIVLTGPMEPHLLDDLDQSLVGREESSPLKEARIVMDEQSTNWTVGPCPTIGWANLVYPEIESDDAALARLWKEIEHVCRLDCDDPVAAWRNRLDELTQAAGAMNDQRFDRLRFAGPGTDLTVGLLTTSSWSTAMFETADGLRHMPNLPSEEVFTTPDPMRTEGVVRSTKPLVVGGTIVEGLTVEFKGGRVIRLEADQGADALRALVARDEGSARLGEVALVDGSGRIGPLGTVFYDTLLDENAASHIALGHGFPFSVEGDDVDRINGSEIHIDFMIGSPEIQVFGTRADGTEVPVLIEGNWKL